MGVAFNGKLFYVGSEGAFWHYFMQFLKGRDVVMVEPIISHFAPLNIPQKLCKNNSSYI